MSNHLSSNPEFIKSFITVCYENGLNEKQASTLLDAYAKNEFYLNDKNFREGLEDTIKQAAPSVPSALYNLIKSIGSSAINNPKFSVPIGGGLAAGALTPEGVLPDDYAGGALTGGALGGLLGLIATRGKGLGAAVSQLGGAAARGGVGRTAAGQGLKLLTHPKMWGGAALGALTGASAVSADKLKDFILNTRPNLPPAFKIPGSASAKDSKPAPYISNPYELPNEVMARNARGLTTSYESGGDSLSGQKQQLLDLENKISDLQKNLPIATNPASYSERLALQSQIDGLKAQRNVIASNIGSAEQKIVNDRQMAMANALERQNAATRGLQTYQDEYENLMRRKEIESGGGVSGSLMGLYNRITGMPARLEAMAPNYSAYQSELEQAQKDQELLR